MYASSRMSFLNYTNDKSFLTTILPAIMEKIFYGFHSSKPILFPPVCFHMCSEHNEISNEIIAITFMHLGFLNIQTLETF
jgi:hypothetical protein